MLKDSCKNLTVSSRSKAALRGDRRTESTCKGRMNQTLQCTVLYPGLFILCANKLPPSNADGNKCVCALRLLPRVTVEEGTASPLALV